MGLVIELHEDKQLRLPAYEAGLPTVGAGELDLVLVLGCVQDHLDSVAAIVATARSSPLQPKCLAVNVGSVEPPAATLAALHTNTLQLRLPTNSDGSGVDCNIRRCAGRCLSSRARSSKPCKATTPTAVSHPPSPLC